MGKLLSIIIPTYNMEKYLHKCLDSLIVSEENMKRLEVLVINDGSKDSSSQIGHEYESKYPQTFRVIDKENGNYGSCINRGLKEAAGKYVKVLDADDYYDNLVFVKFINYLSDKDVDLIINDFCIVDEDDKVTETFTFPFATDRTFSLDDYYHVASDWLWHHGITYKREILTNMGYKQTEGISYSDDEWIFKPMLYVDAVGYFPQLLYYYLRGREGQTFNPKVIERSLPQMIVVAHSLIDFYVEHKQDSAIKNCSYLRGKLLNRLHSLYIRCLLWYRSDDSISRLMELDNKIKDYIPEMYEGMNEEKNRIGRKYIYNWRNNNFKPSPLDYFAYKLIRALKKLIGDKSMHMPQSLKRQD